MGLAAVAARRVTAQGAAPARQAAPLPRTADGKPDLSGIWEVLSKADYNIEPHSASRLAPASAGIVEGGELPYKPGMVEKRKANVAARATADTEAKCYLPGVPRIMYIEHPFQIVQTPDSVLMLFEYVHATRNVFLNSPHLKGPLDWWMGDSRGKWEGDTLVVDANNFNDQTPGSTAPATSTAMRCTSSSGTRSPIAITSTTRPPSTTRKCSRGHGR